MKQVLPAKNKFEIAALTPQKRKFLKTNLYYSKKEDKIIIKRQETKERKLKRGTKLLKRNLDGNQVKSSV